MLEKTGILGMIGKAERGPVAIEAIRKHKAASLIAVGGAAYLVSKAIRKARIVAFEDLGMEAIREFEVADMPVTVAVDSRGDSAHRRSTRMAGKDRDHPGRAGVAPGPGPPAPFPSHSCSLNLDPGV